MLIILLLVLLL